MLQEQSNQLQKWNVSELKRQPKFFSEDDLTEVVQVEEIFSNATQGQIASESQLESAFPGLDKTGMIKYVRQIRRELISQILEHGEMQISQKEREVFTGNKFKEVANIIASRIVHPLTNRPFPVEVVEEAMKNVKFNSKMNEDSKKQAVSCMRTLVKKYKVIRARMLIVLSCEQKYFTELLSFVQSKSQGEFEEDGERFFASFKELKSDKSGRSQIEVVAEPSRFRDLSEFMSKKLPTGALEMVEEAIINNTIGDIDEVNVMEPREDFNAEEDAQNDKANKGKAAEKQIDEMDIDRDVQATENEGGIKAAPKKGGKKRNNKSVQERSEAWAERKILEVEKIEHNFQQKQEFYADAGIKPADKKKKKKKKNVEAYNLGADPQQRKAKKEEEKEYEFSRVPEAVMAELQEQEFEYYCSSCPFGTNDINEYKAHFKTEWHKFNVIRKAESLFMVDEEQFKEYTVLKDFMKN